MGWRAKPVTGGGGDLTQDEEALALGLRPQIGLTRRILGYLLVGGLSTFVSYVVTRLLMPAVGVELAAIPAWIASLCVGFAVNRRMTFGLVGARRRARQFALFTLGALTQLGLTVAGYAVTMGKLGLDYNVAFAINIVTSTIFGFIYVNLVVFRVAK
jgi:putative flippase GtrA